MADLTITLKAQSVGVLGPSQATLWGTSMVWGVSGWGSKAAGAGNAPEILVTIEKVWSGSNLIAPTMTAGSLYFSVVKVWSGSNSISVTYANSDKEEYDRAGYNYVFIDRVINAESGVTQTYASQAVAALTYSSQAAASTTWS